MPESFCARMERRDESFSPKTAPSISGLILVAMAPSSRLQILF
jgi:hypothetical protein